MRKIEIIGTIDYEDLLRILDEDEGPAKTDQGLAMPGDQPDTLK